MLFKLFLAFSLVPALEIALLIKVGSAIGLGPTLALVLASALLGAWLARSQGAAALGALREKARQGVLPADEILDACLIFAAGLVLLAPGFVTDALGLALLFPPIREQGKRWLRARFAVLVAQGAARRAPFP